MVQYVQSCLLYVRYCINKSESNIQRYVLYIRNSYALRMQVYALLTNGKNCISCVCFMIYNIWKKYGVCKVRSFTKKFKLIIFFSLNSCLQSDLHKESINQVLNPNDTPKLKTGGTSHMTTAVQIQTLRLRLRRKRLGLLVTAWIIKKEHQKNALLLYVNAIFQWKLHFTSFRKTTCIYHFFLAFSCYFFPISYYHSFFS